MSVTCVEGAHWAGCLAEGVKKGSKFRLCHRKMTSGFRCKGF